MGRRHERRFDRMGRRVLDGPAQLDPEVRRAASRRALGALPEAVRGYVAKVHDHAYKVTDDDIQALRDAGWSDEKILEAVWVVVFFNLINRLADTLGLSEDDFQADLERARELLAG